MEGMATSARKGSVRVFNLQPEEFICVLNFHVSYFTEDQNHVDCIMDVGAFASLRVCGSYWLQYQFQQILRERERSHGFAHIG